MPAKDSVFAVIAVGGLAAGAGQYRILRTTEIDSYEVATPLELGVLDPTTLAAPVGDSFKGTARKAAKLSIVSSPPKTYSDLKALVASLPPDEDMIDHTPKITATATSNRVKEEKRNVRVTAYLYAASKETDNDYHLIVGRRPDEPEELYMTMELSGLPPKSSKHYDRLKSARDAYKGFFGNNLPGMTYDFPDPPVPIRVTGSLFFDVSHSNGQRPGPQSLKSRMPTIWEIHPISEITFEP